MGLHADVGYCQPALSFGWLLYKTQGCKSLDSVSIISCSDAHVHRTYVQGTMPTAIKPPLTFVRNEYASRL